MTAPKPEVDPFYVGLFVHLLQDAANSLNIRKRTTERDIASLKAGIDQYGYEYITVHLPAIGKALDKALSSDTMFVCPPSCKARRRYGAIIYPAFLGDYWRMIFDVDGRIGECDEYLVDRREGRRNYIYDEGVYTSEPIDYRESAVQIAAVRAVRQICYLTYKLRLPWTKEQEAEKLKGYESLDQSLPDVDSHVDLSPEAYRALENANLLLSYVLRGLDPGEVVPQHGPGSVATGEKPWEKHLFLRRYRELDKYYPFEVNNLFNHHHYDDALESLSTLENVDESCTKICLVPKDSRGPRLIAMEPLEVQWIQQGLARKIYDLVEDPRSITSGYVNFTDQEVNRRLALRHAHWFGEFVTLDLSDASDRVSAWLVHQIFPQHIVDHLMACRSPLTEFPDGHRLRLKKFASMGSAVCFPVEALTFWSLAVGSLTRLRGAKDLRDLPEVYVYGDDIICKHADYEFIRPVFEELNLKFNENKCCTGRFFRESCGCDAFKSEDVTPIRIQKLWSDDLSPDALLSYVSYANRLWDGVRHYPLTAQYVRDAVEEQFGSLPSGQRGCSYSLAFTFGYRDVETIMDQHLLRKRRWNKRYSREEYKLPMVVPCLFNETVELNWSGLFRTLHSKVDTFGVGGPLLPVGTFTVPDAVMLRWSWVCLTDMLTST